MWGGEWAVERKRDEHHPYKISKAGKTQSLSVASTAVHHTHSAWAG